MQMPSHKEPFALWVRMGQAAAREGHMDKVVSAQMILGAADADVCPTKIPFVAPPFLAAVSTIVSRRLRFALGQR